LTRNDQRLMGAALALSERGRGRTGPNPNVGCVLVKEGVIIGRGWTQPGGRPHAEAMALNEAGAAANGATAYVTLEPCAHESERGPACADSLIAAGISRLIFALSDPDPRTNGKGAERLRAVDIDVAELPSAKAAARRAMAPWLSVIKRGRPFVTLKLATSLDGCIARADGESQWITGKVARAHGHLERARHDAILVGRGTYEADAPRLDVRLPGLERESPRRVLLTSGAAPEGWKALRSPEAIASLKDVQSLLVEGGAQTASSFLKAGLVDRILHYRAPIILGGGLPCLRDIGLSALSEAHGRWTRVDTRSLGNDTLDVYEAS
jgi:diaminohydroxyphosphoribosylaminopyrimidine deaminase/5-amino-6-(5-phosphoribosylamino)uracil reductase